MFIYGAIFTSFASLVAQRLPVGSSIFRPGSHCDACQHKLAGRDLVPILSYFVNQGRCRWCKGAISSRYPLFEFIGGCLAAATYLLVHDWRQLVAWSIFWLFLLAVVQTDLLYMRVPNVLSMPGAVVFLVLSMAAGVQTPDQALWGFGVNLVLLFLLVVLSGGKMGVGDMKLYASIGAMLGPWLGVLSLVFASFSGSVVGLGLRASGLVKKREYIPFVPHIAIGVILAVFFGPSLLHWYAHQLQPK